MPDPQEMQGNPDEQAAPPDPNQGAPAPDAGAPPAAAPSAPAPTAPMQGAAPQAASAGGADRNVGARQAMLQKMEQAKQLPHALFGQAARFLLGTSVDYQANDKGQIQAVPVQQKPGQLFRSLLAGALLGGAAGAEGGGKGGFAGSVSRGATAQQQQSVQEDQQKFARAQQNFQNQQATQRENREQESAMTEKQVRLAQVAQANASTLHSQFLIKKGNYDLTKEGVDQGKDTLHMWEESGAKIPYRNIPENKMQDLMQQGDAHNYKWVPSGMQTAIDPNTKQPYLEQTYSAIDPSARVAFTAPMLKMFKDADMDVSRFKTGQEISGDAMLGLYQQYKSNYNQKLTTTVNDLAQGKTSAEIVKMRAEAAHLMSEAAKNRLSTKASQLLDTALTEYNDVGGDFDKLSPKSKAVVTQSYGKMISELSSAANAQLKLDPLDESGNAKKIMVQIGQLGSLIPRSFIQGKPNPPSTPGQQLPSDMAQRYFNAAGGDPNKARQAAAADGWAVVKGQSTQAAPPAEQGNPDQVTWGEVGQMVGDYVPQWYKDSWTKTNPNEKQPEKPTAKP